MQAMRKIIRIDKGKITVDIPEYFGEEVEVIILPMQGKERSFSYYLMKCQEESGFAKEVLASEREDIWNDV